MMLRTAPVPPPAQGQPDTRGPDGTEAERRQSSQSEPHMSPVERREQAR